MDPRGIAEEVANWYLSQLDPYSPHCANVKKHLRGPVLCLAKSILSCEDQAIDTAGVDGCDKEDEKKCSGSDGGGHLDKSLWYLEVDSKIMDDLYLSFGRRHRARLNAFITGVEVSVPSHPKQIGEESLSKVNASSTKVSKPAAKHPISTKKNVHSSPVLTSLNHTGKVILRSVSAEPNFTRKQPQIRFQELCIRLELLIRCLFRVRSLDQDSAIAVEPDRAIRARADILVSAFVSTVGCVRSMGPTLTKLMMNLTKELLAVEFVGEDLCRVIQRIVSEYEHETSFASLAFLSSPDVAAETRLTPKILQYIRYLQSDWSTHERACELERMLSCSLDGNMRRFLKTVEFQSIGHLLEVCQGLRHELTSIELTPSNTDAKNGRDLCNNPDAVRQAVRDLQREVITINGRALPPVSSRSDLIHLLSQALNSRSLTASPLQNEDDDVNLQLTESCPSFISTQQTGSTDESSLDCGSPGRNSCGSPGTDSNRKASFVLTTVDLLTRRLLIAASRTGTGGDAYFIVRDLFGGDDVEVVPAKILPHHVRATRVGSIEIQVRLASITIKCHGSFDVYPKTLVESCEPLIQLHTTSSETIFLQELRPCDSSSDDGRICYADDGSRSSVGEEHLVLQEKCTSKSGRRILSIRPALYEKVQVWNTLS